jgi:cytochrome c oxidase subunit I
MVMNQIATIGAWIIGISYSIMLANLIKSAGYGKLAAEDTFKIGERYYDYARGEPQY